MLELPPLIIPPAQSRCLPWHTEIWSSLTTQYANGRLPHAMLLEGQPGTGRNRLALSLARHLLCSERGCDGNCGNCKTCTLSASGAHPDLLTVVPVETGKAIGIDAVREVIRFAAGTPTLGRSKVMLISPAESLTQAAFNAFLKCLEEPSSETFIILVCASGYPLPATIRSRCQRWQLPSPSMLHSREWLLDALDGETSSSQPIDEMLELCAGRPLDAMEKLQSDESDALIGLYSTAKAILTDGRPSPALEQAVAKVQPDSALDVLESNLQGWLRELPAGKLRSGEAQRGFAALETIAGLRAAKRSGTNPNVDLLRFSATSVINRLWDR
ncbi:DNA polymerase III subunit delta' [Congregibacter variabilis]|uniref:DNA-directed DNA polymerase n=1 Tax=Congregibacter variabilis TaxID=3081200 RepID=A0ABZ0I4Q6_9GAMM|nr:DNA polymerase III subunit delta' [Congregibacter sp. IMCC43200]